MTPSHATSPMLLSADSADASHLYSSHWTWMLCFNYLFCHVWPDFILNCCMKYKRYLRIIHGATGYRDQPLRMPSRMNELHVGEHPLGQTEYNWNYNDDARGSRQGRKDKFEHFILFGIHEWRRFYAIHTSPLIKIPKFWTFLTFLTWKAGSNKTPWRNKNVQKVFFWRRNLLRQILNKFGRSSRRKRQFWMFHPTRHVKF